jgi:hypothetical protein
LKRAKKLLRQSRQAQNVILYNGNGLAFASQQIPNSTAQQTQAATSHFQSQPQQSTLSKLFSWGNQRIIDYPGNLASPQFPSLPSRQL